SAGAIAVSRVFLGDRPDFGIVLQPYTSFATVPLHLLLGVVAGLLGVAYNKTILGSLAATDRRLNWPAERLALAIGGVVGILAWFAPSVVGGGDPITLRTLEGIEPLRWLVVVFLVRFVLGPVSYAARTPGGLFAPLLVLGAQSGLIFGILCARYFPDWAPD